MEIDGTRARARYEQQIARAHRALYLAHQTAVELNDLGAADDTFQLLAELARLGEDSLRGRSRRLGHSVLSSQLRLPLS